MIKSIECEVKQFALKTPFITALRRVESVEFVRVYVTYSNGYTGIGEAPATKAITGEGIEDIAKSITFIKDKLKNKTIKEALNILHKSEIGSSAKASLDMALISIDAKLQNKPLYRYLGAKEPIRINTDITISLKDSAKMLEDSIQAFKGGMEILKVKLGKDIKHAVEVTKSISKELKDAKIVIDANQAWSVDDSLKYIDEIMDCKIELIEQPVKAADLDGLKKITNYSNIPILADESVFTLLDAKGVVESCSADMINIKLMKCGGLTKAVEILEYAREKRIKCMLGSMLEGPYSINVALHLAMAYSDVIKYIDLDSPLLYKFKSDELEFKFNGCEISFKI